MEFGCRLRKLQKVLYLCASRPLTAVHIVHNIVLGGHCAQQIYVSGASKNTTVHNLHNYMWQSYNIDIPIQIFESWARCRTILHCVGPSHLLKYTQYL